MGWGGGGKGGWTPVWQPQWEKQSWDGGWGKGGGKGKGKGKGHRDFFAEKKVWIGGIPEGATYKELNELMKPAGAKWVEVFSGNGAGTGVACFGTEEEAQQAIATLNGASLNGASIQVDVWTKKPKEGGK